MPKNKTEKQAVRHDPLHVQMDKIRSVEMDVKPIKGKRKQEKVESDIVDPKTSQKILKMIREQQKDIAEEQAIPEVSIPKSRPGKKIINENSDDEIEDELEYEEWNEGGDLDIDIKDQELMEKFMNPGERQRVNLSELIMSKINEANHGEHRNTEAHQTPEMNPKVIDVYTKVGLLLSRYKSGPIPKTFKIIPNLRDWEQVLYITNPEAWTTQAMYQATRIFTSNLKTKMAQRFFNILLLEKIRDDIQENKKLNYHLYMSIKKALYKPAAFFKGFLLPLLESGTCTLREAAIIGSVLVKCSVPVLHSAAALLKIAEMEYSGPNSLFIRLLLDKKYALPYKVIDSLVFHFIAFKHDERELPVLWHQSLLVFAQRFVTLIRYKEDLTPEQKDAILDLIKYKTHHQITPEIRYEIQNSVCRGEIKTEDTDML